MAHTKKDKGDLGAVKCIADMTEQGWNIAIPITEHAKYDFVAEKDGELLRVQARYSKKSKDGAINVKLRSSWADRNGVHVRNRTQGDFDILAVYCPDTRTCYYLRDENFSNGSSVSLKTNTPKNGQTKGIRMAEEFTAV